MTITARIRPFLLDLLVDVAEDQCRHHVRGLATRWSW